MMNSLSRQLTKGTLAIAARPRVAGSETRSTLTSINTAFKMLSLGGLLLGGTLLLTPAAQASIRACLPSETLVSFISSGSCQAPDGDGNPGASDKIFTIDSSLTSSALNWRAGNITITTDPLGSSTDPSDQLYRLGYQRTAGRLPWGTPDNNNQFTLAYTIEIDPAFIKDIEFSSVRFGVDVSRAGIQSTSQIWTDGFNGSSPLLGTPLNLTNGGTSPVNLTNGGTSPVAPIATDFPTITKLYVLNTIQRTKLNAPTGEINGFTNEFGQREREIPEPSMIFGILAVAGVGAFSRFRGK